MQEKSRKPEKPTDTGPFIRDTDMAGELLELIKAAILAEAGMSVLAQANVSPEGVILLLRRSGG